MNILWLSTRSPYPLISGHSLRTYHTLRNASERHGIFLVTFVQLPLELEEENLGQVEGLCRCVDPFRIPLDRSRILLGASLARNLFSGLPFVAEKYDVGAMRRRIRNIIRKERIDLVHVDLLHLSVYLDEFPEMPKVITNHNVESLRVYRWSQAERNPLKKLYLREQWRRLRVFERNALNRFDACIVVSKTDRDTLETMGVQSKMFIVPNGTDTEHFRPGGGKTDPDRVLWLGHMDVHTNRDAVLYYWREIFPILRRRHPAARMEFIGTSPPREIVEAAKTDSRLRAPGFVEDIRPYLEKASVVVVPIRIGSGTRVKILDAMALGKAIVSTSVGCEGLDVKDGRDICIADDPEGFAHKTAMLLRDEDLRTALERNARRSALRYDWRLVAEEQERAYQYAVQQHHSPAAAGNG